MNPIPAPIKLDGFANVLFSASLAALIVVDQRARIVLANPAAASLFGYSDDEICELTVESLIPSDARKDHAAHRQQYHESPEDRRMGAGRILHGLHKSGHQIPVEVGLTPIKHEGRELVMATIIDLTERKTSEAQLQRTIDESQIVIDALPAQVFIKDLDNHVLRVNRAVAESLDMPRDQIEGKHSEELYPKDAKRFHADDMSVIKTGKPRMAYTQPIADRWMQTDKIPIRNAAGSIDQIMVVATDITELKNAIESEKAVRRQLQKTGQIAKVGGWEVVLGDEAGPNWSPEVCRMHEVEEGFRPTLEQAISFYTPESRPKIQQVVQECIDDLKPWDVEATIRTAKGNLRRVRAAGEPEVVDGKCIRLWGTFQDITEQYEASQRLKLAQQTIDKMDDAVFFIRKDGSFSYVNEQAATYLGYSREELCTMTVSDINPSYPIEAWPEHWLEAKQKGVLSFESAHTRKDGSTYDCEIRKHFMEFDRQPLVVAQVRDITAINLAKKDLLRSKFSVDNSYDAIYWVRQDGSFFYANNAACKMLGHTREQLLKLSVVDIDPNYPPDVWAQHWQRMKRDKYMRLETEHSTADGESIWVEMNIHLYTLEDEEFIVGTARDISETQKAQLALADSEDRYNWLMKNANLGWWDWDVKTGEVIFGEQTKTQLGYPADTVWNSFDEWQKRVHPDDLEGALQRAGQLTQKPRELYDSTFRLRTADGGYRWIRSIGRGVFDDSGELRRCRGVHVDIHEAYEAQQELLASELRYRTLFEESPQMHVNVDAETGCILDCNRLLVRQLGYAKKSDVIGKHISQMYDESCHAALNEAFELFRTEGKIENCELLVSTRTGEQIPIILNVSAVRDETGKILYSSATWSDITELKSYTEKLERANEELERFAYVASHDLRSPLRAIDHLATWLEEDLDDALPEKSASHLVELRNRVQRMERLLDDLLEYSRAGRVRSEIKRIELDSMTRDLGELLDMEGRFQITSEHQVGEIIGFHSPFETVLRNLIGNAVKHHDKDQGSIVISTKPASGQPSLMLVQVSDDGPGIERKYHGRVFEMFQTLKPIDATEGSGMGLSLAKKLVEAEGGRIWLEPNHPRGMRVCFTWPMYVSIQ